MKHQVTYTRLCIKDREEISRYLVGGMSFQHIARQLNRPCSTITKEVNRDGMDRYTYRAVAAHRFSQRNMKERKQGKRILIKNEKLERYIIEHLKNNQWSPQTIAKRLKIDYPEDTTMRVSSETIYSYLYVVPKGQLREQLLSSLRRNHKRRKKLSENRAKIPKDLPDMVPIEDRPKEVEERTIPGHWEGDTILGKNRQSAIGTLTERTTRTTLIVPLKDKTADTVRRAFARAIKRFPQDMKRSLTLDQGRENAEHRLFTKNTKIQVYFAHKASPWERGTNENTNGLIRQYFPKGTDFTKVSPYQLKRVQDLLNDRPRGVLNYKKPNEVYQELLR